MSSFSNDYIQRNLSSILTLEVFELVAAISEYKGKETLYEHQSPEILKRLQEVATIQSAESFNRIEGIVVNGNRLKELMADRTSPQNRSENEVVSYQAVLSQIHASTQEIPITPNVIKQLHGMLYRFSLEGGQFKIYGNGRMARLLTLLCLYQAGY
jgi:Fic family protein